MKKVLIILCCLMIFPLQVSIVYASEKLENLKVELLDIPQNAKYIDLLISINEKDEAYTPYNKENMEMYSFDTNELKIYNIDGYMSLSYHYKDVFTRMEIQPMQRGQFLNSLNGFTLEKDENGELYQNTSLVNKMIEEKRSFKVVILDKDGKIFRISDSFDITGKKGNVIGMVKYYVANNNLIVNYEYDGAFMRYINPLYYVAFIFIIIIIVIILSSAVKISEISNKEIREKKKKELIKSVIISIIIMTVTLMLLNLLFLN